MKTGLRIILIHIFILVYLSAKAQDDGYKPIVNNEISLCLGKIEKTSASLTSLQCSFTQKKIISVITESVVSKGKLQFKKENKLSWEYFTPYYYLFVLNGDKVYLKNDKTTSQFDTKSNAIFKEISILLVNSISGTGLIDPKKFDVKFYENSSTVKVYLTPKVKALKSIMSTITLYFEKSTYLVHTIEMTESSGDSTTIVFSDVKLNQPISDENFVVH